jgi:GT2 family glycosyltransferase
MSDELAEQLTLVLLTYNCAHRIGHILDRACELGVPVVAVDNASRDGTDRIVANRPGIHAIVLPRNIGAAGRNIGVQAARTRYVAFCDDDGWYEPDGLVRAVEALERYPRLALVNARILVGDEQELDPISAEMAESPLPDRDGIPGTVLLGFMAGAVVMRTAAYREVGGYDPMFFIGGEEETLAMKLARAGWHMRYREDVVMHHLPSVANAPYLRSFGMRNTLWNSWLHRRAGNALRWTAFTLADSPKNRDWVLGVGRAARGLPTILRRRRAMPESLDHDYAVLDARRMASRRPLLSREDPLQELREADHPLLELLH